MELAKIQIGHQVSLYEDLLSQSANFPCAHSLILDCD
jgi:hypothetical protein